MEQPQKETIDGGLGPTLDLPQQSLRTIQELLDLAVMALGIGEKADSIGEKDRNIRIAREMVRAAIGELRDVRSGALRAPSELEDVGNWRSVGSAAADVVDRIPRP